MKLYHAVTLGETVYYCHSKPQFDALGPVVKTGYWSVTLTVVSGWTTTSAINQSDERVTLH